VACLRTINFSGGSLFKYKGIYRGTETEKSKEKKKKIRFEIEWNDLGELGIDLFELVKGGRFYKRSDEGDSPRGARNQGEREIYRLLV